MTPIEKFVNDLMEWERHAIIESYEQFTRDGFIGEEPIRVYARKFCESRDMEENYITLWMELLAKECYRYFYRANYKE